MQYLANEAATVAAGERLGHAAQPGTVLFLEGDLGAGKTTFCRGFLRAFRYSGAVKSPTYTLVEPYELSAGLIYHFDLYRLGDPEELEYMGIRDYIGNHSICLIEWPERGVGVLPTPDIRVRIETDGSARTLQIESASALGERIAQRYQADER
ncbi:tRNA (adenosine(37)-N6)-threonylcarbamoyltransferase complex ATPase subunit type 1 TsaE [Litorivivens sp.]|uniref:tRNA (adenosine(37)-N6)-threonylcarbamoyltransferase complex ATPase subunit type 1 TsaE n=2 Tax=Litorivivens sp. TaxID=2020868 RepID=UPI003566825B